MTLDELREKAEQERNAQRRFVHSLRVCVAAGCLLASLASADPLPQSGGAGVPTRGVGTRKKLVRHHQLSC